MSSSFLFWAASSCLFPPHFKKVTSKGGNEIQLDSIPIGSMYAIYIYGNIYHQDTPNVSIYSIHMHTWILWDMDSVLIQYKK